MATFFEPFDYAAAYGTQAEWDSNANWGYLEGYGPSYGTCDGAGVLTIDAVGGSSVRMVCEALATDTGTVEVVAKVKVTALPSNDTNWQLGYVGPCISYNTSLKNWRVVWRYEGGANKWYIINGPDASVDEVSSGVADTTSGLFDLVADTWFWVRIRREISGGKDLIKCRMWADGGSEDTGSWPLTYTSVANSIGAACGKLYCNTNSFNPIKVDTFGSASAGDTAPTTALTVPIISDASDESFYTGESVAFSGSNFGNTQGTGKVYISPTNSVADAGKVEQTVTSWGPSGITITVVKGALSFLTPYYLFVTEDGGQSSAGYAVQLEPKVYIRETLVDLNANAVTNQSGLTAFIWRTLPSNTNMTPDQAVTAIASNGSGAVDFQIARGSLAVNAPVWVMLFKDGSPFKATVRKITPVYE